MDYHRESLVKALQTAYPEKSFHPWLFLKVPHNFWNEEKNETEFMNWLCAKLDIKEPSDWYKTTAKQIGDLGGGSLLLKYGNYGLFLQAKYPGM